LRWGLYDIMSNALIWRQFFDYEDTDDEEERQARIDRELELVRRGESPGTNTIIGFTSFFTGHKIKIYDSQLPLPWTGAVKVGPNDLTATDKTMEVYEFTPKPVDIKMDKLLKRTLENRKVYVNGTSASTLPTLHYLR
jgi:hypothetical protein